MTAAFLLGTALIVVTYAAGVLWARLLLRREPHRRHARGTRVRDTR